MQSNAEKVNFGSGIDEKLVEISGDFQDLVKSFVCCICLDIVKFPMQCEKCESLYCGECWDILKTAGKPCVYNCPASCIKNTRKFVLELLKHLSLRCNMCGVKGIDYHMYVKHIEGCSLNSKFSNREEIQNEIKDKDKRIEILKHELKSLKDRQLEKQKDHEELLKSQSQFSNQKADPEKQKLRDELITHNLSSNQKMDLYKAVLEGRVLDFKNLITQKNYPILEEISAANY